MRAGTETTRGGPSPKEASLSVFTFEAGGHLFAVQSRDVLRILAPGQPVPEGLDVVDIVGLLEQAAGGPRDAHHGKTYLVVLAGERSSSVGLTASCAGEVTELSAAELLPIPGYLFRGANPFLGLFAPGCGGRPVFLLAGPERLLAAAGSL